MPESYYYPKQSRELSCGPNSKADSMGVPTDLAREVKCFDEIFKSLHMIEEKITYDNSCMLESINKLNSSSYMYPPQKDIDVTKQSSVIHDLKEILDRIHKEFDKTDFIREELNRLV